MKKTVAFGSSAPIASVERLESAIRALVSERLALRELGAGRAELEENRRRLVRLQWRLAKALIKLHLPADTGIGTRVAA